MRLVLWEQRDSNPRPSACKADALNQLSYAPSNLDCKYTSNFQSAKYFQKLFKSERCVELLQTPVLWKIVLV